MVGCGAWLRWLSVGGLVWASVVASANSATAAGTKFAVVIGVSYCEDKSTAELPFVENDVALVSETLAARGFDVYPFCEESVTLDATNKKIKKRQLPTKANIERAFAEGKNGPLANVFKYKDATLLVYFSGHGRVASEKSGQTRLVLRDSKNDDPEGSTLRAQTLRKMMNATPCKRRLLLLDSCCAAGTRDVSKDEEKTYSELFANSFLEGGVGGVPTFASCSFRGVSGALLPYVKKFNETQKKRDVSLFTYWVVEALKGRADGAVDEQTDGVVGSDELFAYVEQNIRWMRSEGRSWQTPAIVAAKDEKPFKVCDVLPRSYGETLDDMAEQIVTKAKILGKKEIFVEDFDETFASANLRSDGDEVAALHSFAVSATELLRANVREKWRALQKGTLTRIEGSATDRRFVVKGVVEARERAERDVSYVMSCKEVVAGKGTPQDFAAASAILQRKYAPEGALKGVDDGTQKNVLPTNVRIEARSANENAWRTRPICEIDGVQWVELNPGETYRVVFEPNAAAPSAENFIMRFLVDGRNSLAQYEPSVTPPSDFWWQVEEITQDGEAANAETSTAEDAQVAQNIVLAPAVPLDHANFWVLDPRQKYVVDGFCDQFSQTSAAFTVVKADASDADAADEDERGLLVFAFYKSARSRNGRSLNEVGDAMTVPGPKQRYSTIVVKGLEPGAPLGILRLRYASAEFLARLKKEAAPATPLVGGENE